MSQTIYAAKERIRPLRNNDPLAHVYLLQDSYDGQLADHRMRTEFITDMGERLKNQPFRSTFTYTYNSNEMTYDTGLRYIASLEQSYVAAVSDVAAGSFSAYHAERQKAFYEQGKQVIDWLNDQESSQHILLFSLCPSEDELPYHEAEKQSFKPNRMMASIQLHSKNSDGTAATVAFSLDGLTLARLQALLHNLGVADEVRRSTVDQLTAPTYIYSENSAEDIVDSIISTYDTQLKTETTRMHLQGVLQEGITTEANAFVATHPEAYLLYKKVIEQVATSLQATKVQPDLAHTISIELAGHYKETAYMPHVLRMNSGDMFTPALASELIDYLRKRAIPEYLTQQLQRPHRTVSTSYSDIGFAGATATQSGRVYDGACPSSSSAIVQMSAIDQAVQMGLQIAVTYEAPKPLFIKGNYAVIPIGACPASCKTECGIGIQDRRSGEWFCANSKKCSAYDADVFSLVFEESVMPQTDVYTENEQHITGNLVNKKPHMDTVGYELRQTQSFIWMLRARLYDETTDDIERKELVTNLIDADQRKQYLLRVAMGYIAYEPAIQNVA